MSSDCLFWVFLSDWQSCLCICSSTHNGHLFTVNGIDVGADEQEEPVNCGCVSLWHFMILISFVVVMKGFVRGTEEESEAQALIFDWYLVIAKHQSINRANNDPSMPLLANARGCRMY
jgi:hypothetical protein